MYSIARFPVYCCRPLSTNFSLHLYLHFVDPSQGEGLRGNADGFVRCRIAHLEKAWVEGDGGRSRLVALNAPKSASSCFRYDAVMTDIGNLTLRLRLVGCSPRRSASGMLPRQDR